MSYVLPQVQVFQEFRQLPTAVVSNLNAFVFGPHYQLFRYAEAAEKALVGLGAYDKDSDTPYSYPSLPAGSTVDLDYVKLYMDNVWAEYLSIPNAAASPLYMVSELERNKLRAAPYIEAPENQDITHPVLGTDYVGYFIGGVALPEYYYFWPMGGWTGSQWEATGYQSDLAASPGQDSRLAYITSEGLTGYVDIDGSDPYTAGIVGPDGIKLDLDPGSSDEVLRRPKVITFSDGTASFTLTPDMAAVGADIIDKAVDLSPALINITVDITAGTGLAVSFSTATLALNVAVDPADTTISELRDELVTDSDIAQYFAIGAITGSETAHVATAVDDASVSVDTVTPVDLLLSSYRMRVTPNPYIFATGNDVGHSAHFKSRGVRVGDRVRYQVTDDSVVTHEGTTKVTGFEADRTLATIADPDNKETNVEDQLVSSLPGAMVAGSDNQRQFNDVNTGVNAIASYLGSLLNGVVSDNYTVEITAPGLAGTAKATVSNDSGTYYRMNVPVEATGADDGEVYIGNGLYVNFDRDAGVDPNAEFQVGDTYRFVADVGAAVNQLTAADMESAGEYDGPSDTTYVVEVVRGGVFDRSVSQQAGRTPLSGTFVPSVDWEGWTGGDVDDEYILLCTQAGDIATAQFSVSSQLSDGAIGVIFGALDANVSLGGKGLAGKFTAATTFAVGEYIIIKLKASRPQVRIYDTAGIDEGAYRLVNDAEDLNLGAYGATLTFAATAHDNLGGGLLKGDVYHVAVTAPADAALNTLILADDLPEEVMAGLDVNGDSNDNPNRFAIWLYLVQSSAEFEAKKTQSPPDYNWEVAAAEITVNQAIAVQDSSWAETDGSMPYLPVYSGDMYVEYRALLTDYTTTIHFISDIGDVVDQLGTITPDNPLSQGVYNALSNSGDRGVYYMAVPSDDNVGFLDALDKASLNEDVYAFTPLTRDLGIINSVEAHINDMSTETNKRWRIGFVGTEMPTELAIYNFASNPGSEEFFATIEDDPGVTGTQYTLVKFVDAGGSPSPYTEALDDLVVGDRLLINFATDAWGDAVYEEYTIASVNSNTQVKLLSGPGAPVTLPTKVEVYHDYTLPEMASAVAAVSSGFSNRRMYHTFPGMLGAFGVLQTGEFGAAAVAGLCSSVPPQQGLTNIEVNGFDDLPMVYSTFNRNQLNTMAEAGTLIIMQDVAGGRVYVRHQVSTAASDGNLNTTELSVTKNLDSISFYFANLLSPYIGRYNITPELLEVLRTQITSGLNYLGSLTSTGLLGPQVILEDEQGNVSELVTLEQHPTYLDHIIATMNLRLPYPLNVIEFHLVV